MTTVYLAGGINGLSDEEAKNWREQFKDLRPDLTYLDPMSRDCRGKEADHYEDIVEMDILDIGNSDIVLANCATPSWGTGMEILLAYEMEKMVIVVVPYGTKKVSPWILYHAEHIVYGLDEASRYIPTQKEDSCTSGFMGHVCQATGRHELHSWSSTEDSLDPGYWSIYWGNKMAHIDLKEDFTYEGPEEWSEPERERKQCTNTLWMNTSWRRCQRDADHEGSCKDNFYIWSIATPGKAERRF